jgi:hypothetical protein
MRTDNFTEGQKQTYSVPIFIVGKSSPVCHNIHHLIIPKLSLILHILFHQRYQLSVMVEIGRKQDIQKQFQA